MFFHFSKASSKHYIEIVFETPCNWDNIVEQKSTLTLHWFWILTLAMKAESSLSKGCLTTRKMVADSRNCCLSATSFGFKVVIRSTANRPLLITPIRKEHCQLWDHPIAQPPTLIGAKRLAAILCIGVRCWISTCSNWISLIVLAPTTDKACDKSMKTCKKWSNSKFNEPNCRQWNEKESQL